ncbi:hypothetical protein Tco_0561823 [Tanacetum coccineum]
MDLTNPRNTKPWDLKDPARIYSVQDLRNRNNFKCNFCFKVTKGRAFRLKKHLVGGFKDVTDCPSLDEDSEDDEEVCVVTSMNRGSGSGEGTSKGLPKMPRHEGPMDMSFARKPEDVLTGGRNLINFENE